MSGTCVCSRRARVQRGVEELRRDADGHEQAKHRREKRGAHGGNYTCPRPRSSANIRLDWSDIGR